METDWKNSSCSGKAQYATTVSMDRRWSGDMTPRL